MSKMLTIQQAAVATNIIRTITCRRPNYNIKLLNSRTIKWYRLDITPTQANGIKTFLYAQQIHVDVISTVEGVISIKFATELPFSIIKHCNRKESFHSRISKLVETEMVSLLSYLHLHQPTTLEVFDHWDRQRVLNC